MLYARIGSSRIDTSYIGGMTILETMIQQSQGWAEFVFTNQYNLYAQESTNLTVVGR